MNDNYNYANHHPVWTLAKITYGKTFDKVNTPGE